MTSPNSWPLCLTPSSMYRHMTSVRKRERHAVTTHHLLQEEDRIEIPSSANTQVSCRRRNAVGEGIAVKTVTREMDLLAYSMHGEV